MINVGTINCSKAWAVPLIINKDTVYVHTDIVEVTEDSMGNPTDNLYTCTEIQYDKDEYIREMAEKNQQLQEATNDLTTCVLEMSELVYA